MIVIENAKRAFGLVLVATIAIYLSACASGGGTGTGSVAEKPPFGINLAESADIQGFKEQYEGVKLDVVVPVFDPNIPDNPDQYDSLGIWPELRRTEAIRFAVSLQDELKATNAFGYVHNTPHTKVSADLYVQGMIVKSNGEDIEISVQVHDTTGKRWMKKTYKHRVKEYHWQNIRQQGKDPYQPVFEKVAKDVVKLLKKRSSDELTRLRATSEIVFASAFTHEAFAEHLEIKNKRVNLVSFPDNDDPMLQRTRAVRVHDLNFMDNMQDNYVEFVAKTNDSYVSWQEHSMLSAKAEREAKAKAGMQALGAALLIFGAAAAADNSSDSAVTRTAVTGAIVGGVMLLQKSFTTSAEGKYHRDNLMELGRSLNVDVAPQVIEIEGREVSLQGDMRSQYRQWQDHLKVMHELEKTPETQL